MRGRDPAAAGRVSLRRIVVPAEHGSWAFLGEPVLLGLVAAWSVAGLLAAVAAIACFLARQPLRLVLGDRRHGRRYPRTAVAERVFAALAALAALAVAGSLALAGPSILPGVILAAPLGAAALGFDLARKSRETAAGITAALALGAAAAVIALAGGWPAGPALGLWGILAARAGPSVLYVRARLRLDRGEPATVALALAAALAGVGAALALAALRLAPWAGVAAIGLLLVRAFFGLSPLRGRWSTARLGFSEVILGLIVVAATGLGARFGG